MQRCIDQLYHVKKLCLCWNLCQYSYTLRKLTLHFDIMLSEFIRNFDLQQDNNDYYLHHKRDCKICLTWFDSRSSNKLPKDLNKKEMKERGTSNWWDNWVIERRSKSFLSADHLVASYILISLLLIFMFLMRFSSISSFFIALRDWS